MLAGEPPFTGPHGAGDHGQAVHRRRSAPARGSRAAVPPSGGAAVLAGAGRAPGGPLRDRRRSSPRRCWRPAARPRSATVEPRAPADKSIAVLPVRQPERRSRQRVLRRRHDRGDHQRARQACRACASPPAPPPSRSRGRRSTSGDRRRSSTSHGPRGKRAQGGQPAPHHGAADQRRPTATSSGPRPTTASWRTSSRSRTRSPKPSSRRSGFN